MTGRACALLLALALVGCGTNEDAERFAAEYRALSATYEQGLEELGDRHAAEPEPERDALLAMYADLRADAVEVRDGLAALDPPPDLREAIDQLVANLERQVATLDRVVEAAERDDAEALAARLEELAALVSAWALADQLVISELPG